MNMIPFSIGQDVRSSLELLDDYIKTHLCRYFFKKTIKHLG